MSGLDTARLLLAGVPTAREVEYPEWTSVSPSCRGELRAAGEVLWFVYAMDEAPPVHELPTEPGAVILGSTVNAVAPRVMVLGRAGSPDRPWLEWCYIDDEGDPASTETPDDDWVPAVVVPASDGPAASFRRILAAVKGKDAQGCIKTLQAVEFTAREALKALDGEL